MHSAGLDSIQEQQPYKGLSPGMLQALSQLGKSCVLHVHAHSKTGLQCPPDAQWLPRISQVSTALSRLL